MKTIVLDKIASVTKNCALGRRVRAGSDFPCKEGDVVAVRVLSSKRVYNQLELTSGRMSFLKPNDVIAGALGHRRALLGYAGHIPEKLAVGDRINILNLGGVLGICDSENPDLGHPFECEVLGQVLNFPYVGERVGVPANIASDVPALAERLDARGVPVIAVVGTCMNSGKTAACSALIQELTHRGLIVHAAKATGVSLRRDTLLMEDSGAARTSTFTDLGIVTTTCGNAPSVTRTQLSLLAASGPDIIVLELGDGLFGTYGVDAILDDPEIRAAFSAVILAANDPVGAWGGVRVLREAYDITPTVVTGPATDNIAGTAIIEERCGVAAINARMHPSELTETILKSLGRELEAHG